MDNQPQIFGMFTIAEAVQNLLLLNPSTDVTLATATDDQVKETVHPILSTPVGDWLLPLESEDAVAIPIEVNGEIVDSAGGGHAVIVASDNEPLGGGGTTFRLSEDEVTLGKERFNRQIQTLLKGKQHNYQMWGIVIVPTLEATEQGRTAFPSFWPPSSLCQWWWP